MTRLLLVLPLLAACGPDKTDSTGDTAATSSTGGTQSTTTPDDTGDVPTSPLSSDTTPSTTTDSGLDTGHDTGLATTAASITTHTATSDATTADTSSTTSATTDTTTSTTDTTTGVDPDAQYVAFFFAGGLAHVLIHKADVMNDRCTTLHLARPTQGDPNLKIVAPAEWGAQNANSTQGVAGCLDGMPGNMGVAAIAGAGTVDFIIDPMLGCPHTVDLDLTLDFPQDMPWVPASEPMQVTDLPVQNCP